MCRSWASQVQPSSLRFSCMSRNRHSPPEVWPPSSEAYPARLDGMGSVGSPSEIEDVAASSPDRGRETRTGLEGKPRRPFERADGAIVTRRVAARDNRPVLAVVAVGGQLD